MDNKELFDDNCPECGGGTISTSHEKICEECGLIINEMLSETSYILNNAIDSMRSKQYVSLGERPDFIGGLGSYIGYERSKYLKDNMGRLLHPNGQKLYRRLKKTYAPFLRIKNHETEYRIFSILNKITLYLGISKHIRNNAAYYFKKILKNEEKIINHISLIAFCIFHSSRKENHNAPITINEIVRAFQSFGHRVSPKLILRDGLTYKSHLSTDSEPHKSEDYLTRLTHEVINHKELENKMLKKKINISKIEYQNILLKKSSEILKKLTIWDRGGRNPFILTGAVIYLADKLLARELGQKALLTQKMISEATKIAEYSIRDHYVNLLKPIFIK
ncbi:MAG: hypothetical protein ACFFAS_20280 [Promethearchaeota archaeon]